MPLVLGCLALFAPRLVIVLVVLFSDAIGEAAGILWPLLGFLFLPTTVLAYTWAWHAGQGSLSGFGVAVVVLAVLIDLGLLGGSSQARRRQRVD